MEYLGGTLTNTGTIDVTGSSDVYAYADNATINNQAGAVFDFQSDGTVFNYYGYVNPTFNNAGTLEMTAGSGTSSVGFALNESGATSVLSNSSAGTLSLSGGGSFGGTVTVSGAVTLAGGTFTVADGTTIEPPSGGSGSLQEAGGTLSLAGSLSTTVLAITGGTLAGTGTIAAGSQVTWSGGTLAGAVTSAGTLAISGSVEYLGGTLTNTGTIDVTGSSDVYAYANNATINNQVGAVFDFQSDGTVFNYYGYVNPTFNNAGTLEMTASSGTATLAFSLSNTGTVQVESGTLDESGTFSNFSGTTLTGGTYFVSGAGQFEFAGANIVTNAASIVLDGTSSEIINTSSGNALAGFATNAAGGQFTVQDSGSFTTAGALTNAGDITVSGGSTLTISGALTESGGSTILAHGTLTSTTGTVTLTDGLLSGTGTVKGNVSNTGVSISPGASGSAGTLTIQGTYTQGAGGSLNVALGGTGAGVGYDQLVVTGSASLGGTINISTINGYVPPVGSAFQVLTFASKTGDFQTYNGLFISGKVGLLPAYTPSANPVNLTLTSSSVVNNWTNPAGGDWDTASNWTYGVPVAGQSVAILYSGITVTHTQATAEPMIASLDDLATLDITSGSIALGNGSSTLGGPVTVGAAGTLSVAAGASVEVGSTLSDAGTVTFSAGNQLSMYGAVFSVSGNLTANDTSFVNTGDGSYMTFTSTATLSGATNTFNLPINVPYNLVPSLAGNTSFDEVAIENGTISSGTLALNLLGTNTSNFYYEFNNGFTVGAGGTMTVAANVPPVVLYGSTLSDAGTVTFSAGNQLSMYGAVFSVSGNLTANDASFVNTGDGSYMTFTSTATLSGGTNTFNLPINVPYNLVPSLAGNTSFDEVAIENGTISSGTLALNLLGTNTSNFYYEFNNGFTVGAGGTMTVAANVPPVVLYGSTLSDAGTVTFSAGNQLSMYGAVFSVSGNLTANDTSFVNTGDGSYMTFTSTATLSGATNTFNLPINVPYNLVPSLAGNTSFDEVAIENGTISSGTLALNLLGTNTSNFYYEFNNGFTVGAGGTMTVAANVRRSCCMDRR